MKKRIIFTFVVILAFIIGVFSGYGINRYTEKKHNIKEADSRSQSIKQKIKNSNNSSQEETTMDYLDYLLEKHEEKRGHDGEEIGFCKEAEDKINGIYKERGVWKGKFNKRNIVIRIEGKNQKSMILGSGKRQDKYDLHIYGDAEWLDDDLYCTGTISYICRMNYSELIYGKPFFYQGILQFDENNDIKLLLSEMTGGGSVLMNGELITLKKQ